LVNAHLPVGKPSLWRSAKTAGFMALLGAPIMAVLFMLFPRLAPLWGIPSDGMSGRSGLSATMSVGNVAQLALDESVAFRVEWLQADGKTPAPAPPTPDLYFRGPVLSTFDGRQWKALESKFPLHLRLPANLEVAGPAIVQRVTLEPNNRPWLFGLEAPIGIATKLPSGETIESTLTPDLQWLAKQPIVDITRYELRSHAQFKHGATVFSPRQALQVQDYVELPPGFNPRTLAWAAELRRRPELANAAAPALVNHVLAELRNGGFRYTLEPGVYGQHTADEFWFDRKEGFCEHIASAFVVLMRAFDVPARIVTGYQGGQVNPIDSVFTVRQSDAHAWAEVWVRGQGWLRVDPTSAVAPERVGSVRRLAAPQTVLGQAVGAVVSPDLAKRMRQAWEAVNNAWNQRVLNYTQSKQLNLLKNLGFESPSWEHLGYVLAGLLVAVGGFGALWTLWQGYEHDPWLRLLKRSKRQLAQRGLPSSARTTPRELAAAASERFGDKAAALAKWLLALEQARYAPADTPANPTANSPSNPPRANTADLRRSLSAALKPLT
jgi:protein-glutamine gamma-glutamyltransferase